MLLSRFSANSWNIIENLTNTELAGNILLTYSMITNTERLVDIFKAAKGIWMPPILINFNGNWASKSLRQFYKSHHK